MQNKLTYINDTKVKILVTADSAALSKTHSDTVKEFQKSMKVPGFRAGKAPLNIVEKNADQARLQSTFLDSAVNLLYATWLPLCTHQSFPRKFRTYRLGPSAPDY